MTNISVSVKNKKATPDGSVIVCGNSDYNLVFSFDAEWDAYGMKTARFVFRKDGETQYIDQVFNGDTVAVPVLSGIHYVLVGVFAGELHTTTPAKIPCAFSVLCHAGEIAEEPPEEIYNQIMEEVGLATGRINALVKSQGTGASQVHEVALSTVNADYVTAGTATITSDGIHAVIELTGLTVYDIPARGGVVLLDIPEALAPICDKTFCDGDIDGQSSAVLEFSISLGRLNLGNPSEVIQNWVSKQSTKLLYTLANPYLPEVNDIRVGLDGTEYETAGDAVRAQMAQAMEDENFYITLSGEGLNTDRTAEEIKGAYTIGKTLYLSVPCINQEPWLEDSDSSVRVIVPLRCVDGSIYTFSGMINFVDSSGYGAATPRYLTVSFQIGGSVLMMGYACVPMDGGGGSGGGITDTARNLLMTVLRNAVYTSNQSATLTALETALKESSSGSGGSGDSGDSGDDSGNTETVTYTITNNLTNCATSNSATSITANSSYAAVITAVDGYELQPVVATMGGSAVTVTDGVISISAVTGNIVITAVAVEETTETVEEVLNAVLFNTDASTTATYPDKTTFEYNVLATQDAVSQYKSMFLFEAPDVTGGTLVLDFDANKISGAFRFMVWLLNADGTAYKILRPDNPPDYTGSGNSLLDGGWSGDMTYTMLDPGSSPVWAKAKGQVCVEIPDGTKPIVSINLNAEYTTILDESLKVNGSDTKMYGISNAALAGEVIIAKIVKEV